MLISKTSTLTPKHESQIDLLWNKEYPIKLKDRFKLLLEGVEYFQHYYITNSDEEVIAWAVVFEKDEEIRFSIIVDSDYQGEGLGKHLVKKLVEDHHEFYGWVIDHDNDLKIDGNNYRSPLPFYIKQGFEVLNDIRIDNEMLSAVKIKWSRN